MSITSRQRPGVYSDYDTSGIIWSDGLGKAVGIVSLNDAQQNTVYTITKTSDAESIFGTSGEMYNLCKLALQNGAMKVLAVSAGTLESNDYETAFKVLESESSVYTVICDSTDSSIHMLLKESILRSCSAQKERIGIVSYGKYEDINEITSWAQDINCERIMLTAQNPMSDTDELSGCLITAAIAGAISANTDPSYSFNSITLKGINKLSNNLSEDDVDTYIENGITPLEIILSEAEIIRLVTSKTATNGISDTTFKDVNTILIIDEIIPGLREMLRSSLLGGKNNVTTRSAISTQTIIKLQEYMDAGLIETYDNPVVSVSSDDATVCIVKVSFTISRGLNQIVISASIKV